MRGKLFAPALVSLALAFAFAAPAGAKTVWLCRPGLAHNPCAVSLKTTLFTPAGKKLRVISPRRVRRPSIDCFYVYPTVSDQKTLQANLRVDPEERSIALFQAARYSQYCRVFAPMYRQLTIPGLESGSSGIPAAIRSAYANVLAAWKDYLAHYNHGRGFVLIGHSQGSGHLIQLMRTQVDGKPALRRRLVSALILGGGLTVRRGRDAGGDLRHIRACHSTRQLGCVVAYSTFDAPVPPNSLFGRGPGLFASVFGQPMGSNLQTLCTNPGALGGGSAPLDTIQPSAPFAPGTLISTAIKLLGVTLPAASTPWIEFRGAYRAHCSTADKASVLQVVARGGAPTPKPSPDATWGLHLLDTNIALGNLVDLVHSEALAYAKRRPRAHG